VNNRYAVVKRLNRISPLLRVLRPSILAVWRSGLVPVTTARAVRKEIEQTTTSRKRGSYDRVSSLNKAKITKYAAENGIMAAIHQFEKEGFKLKERTVQGWRKEHCANIARINASHSDKIADVQGSSRWALSRPLLLGQGVEDKTNGIICSIRDAGGIINNSIVIGILKEIIEDTDSNLLAENGGSLIIEKPIA
jgi:hypothetical protein